jgi:hypothetical protein
MSRYAIDVALGDGDGLDDAYGGSRAATSEMAFFAAREALDYLEPIKRQFSRGIWFVNRYAYSTCSIYTAIQSDP